MSVFPFLENIHCFSIYYVDFRKNERHTQRKTGKDMDADLSPQRFEKERMTMKNNNQLNIPQAREAMDKFKMQAASEVGVLATY